jgi:hypothetical protein
MAQEKGEGLYREKVLKKISTPEQLTDCLRVTNPSVWIILAAVVLLLAGLFVWASVATIETSMDAEIKFARNYGEMEFTSQNGSNVRAGQKVIVGSRTFTVSLVYKAENGHILAYVEGEMPDGEYDARILIRAEHPIDFLFGR